MARNTEHVVIGLNGTGRTLAAILGICKKNKLILVDDDTVSESNYDQGYGAIDVGLLKAEAAKEAIREINSTADISIMDMPLEAALEELENKMGNLVVFCCKPLSNKTRCHIAKTLNTAAQSIYFCGFDDRGDYEICYSGNQSMTLEGLSHLPSSKENADNYRDAAEDLLYWYIRTRQ